MPVEFPESVREQLDVELAEQGLEITDIQYRRESNGQMLRVFIDREQGVNLEACSRATKLVKRHLDAIDFFYDYLEVSSPGVDRRLTRDKDLERFRGSRVLVKMKKAWEGRKRIVGVLQDHDRENLTLETEAGLIGIPRELIGSVNLEPES